VGVAIVLAPAVAGSGPAAQPEARIGVRPATGLDEAARAAIVAAVSSRLRGSVPIHEIRVEDLVVRLRQADGRPLLATLAPDARFGTRQRVTLRALGGRGRAARVGEADCVIRVRASHLEVVSPIARGDALGDGSVRRADGWVEDLPIGPLVASPGGTRAARALAPGDVITARDVLRLPDVRSGDPVQVRVLVHAVEVRLEAVAAQDGRVGDDIRIVNPSSGRLLKARVTGPGSVEVHHGS
jgi:flagella basal body P-ring formation protein FlgA